MDLSTCDSRLSILPTGAGIVQKIYGSRDLANEILQDHEQVF
jgi:hypothetical protein